MAMPYRKLLWDTFAKLNLKPGHKILDAGCGTGNFERFLAEKNAPKVDIEAVDFSTAMLSRAKKKCVNLPYVCFNFADLNEKLNFPNNTFDRIVCLNVLYALKDPHFTLEEFFRVLKGGGKIAVANPKPGAKFAPLIGDHFKRIKNIWGFHRKMWALFKSILMIGTTAVVPILLNIFVIIRRGKKQKYHFLPQVEFKEIFEENNLGNIEVMPAYADQNWFAMATKVPQEATKIPPAISKSTSQL